MAPHRAAKSRWRGIAPERDLTIATAHAASTAAVEIDWDDRQIRIEHAWIDGPAHAPVVVFLHDGAGSLALWRDFPQRVCTALHARGVVYSRPGYGHSSGPTERTRGADYLHRQAHEVLPKVLDALDIHEPVILFGHSDGGTIALLFASRFPERSRAAVVLAPHIFVEDVTVRGVERSLAAYEEGADQRIRLGRYHDDPDAVFRAWTTIWLDPRFRDWNIEGEIARIRCPVLALQGCDDEYATLEQVRGIARRVARTQVVELEHCGHFPQRDQPLRVIDAVVHFLEAT